MYYNKNDENVVSFSVFLKISDCIILTLPLVRM